MRLSLAQTTKVTDGKLIERHMTHGRAPKRRGYKHRVCGVVGRDHAHVTNWRKERLVTGSKLAQRFNNRQNANFGTLAAER
jgi:hypothetical protein